MNPEDNPGKSNFIENTIKYIQASLSPEDVQLLLKDNKVWEKIVTEAELSRDEARAILEGLRKKNHTVVEVKNQHQQEQKYRDKFLKLYPLVKRDVEVHIAQLRALADKADKLHRKCTISKVVASSTGIVSGILTIVGIGLAPVTAGVSLVLFGVSLGLGTASSVTGVTTSIVESTSMASIESNANNLVSTGINPGKVFHEVLKDSDSQMDSSENSFFRSLEDMAKNIHTIRLLNANPHLAAQATLLMNAERISVQSARVLPRALGGAALAVSKGVRIFGAATAGLFILVDVVSLVQDSIDLHKGAKTESAEKLRQRIRELEGMLEKLKQIKEKSSNFVEDTIHYILNALNREDLKFLLSQDEEWKKFVADANLSG
ncbi:apolipoprotein L2-like [Sorex araneus]|uniref:apolipoprotein L2-like n=1 Tax=Sorex araneus TaxID=42254 RepID=UPI0024337099|nr:apolipoprotein L2-like [Sorex araneus]